MEPVSIAKQPQTLVLSRREPQRLLHGRLWLTGRESGPLFADGSLGSGALTAGQSLCGMPHERLFLGAVVEAGDPQAFGQFRLQTDGKGRRPLLLSFFGLTLCRHDGPMRS